MDGWVIDDEGSNFKNRKISLKKGRLILFFGAKELKGVGGLLYWDLVKQIFSPVPFFGSTHIGGVNTGGTLLFSGALLERALNRSVFYPFLGYRGNLGDRLGYPEIGGPLI